MISNLRASWTRALRCWAGHSLLAAGFVLGLSVMNLMGNTPSAWPQGYLVQTNGADGRLALSTPFYTVEHDPTNGGAIASIRLTHGRATNLLLSPIACRVQNQNGRWFSDLRDVHARVSRTQDGLKEIVTVESRLLDDQDRPLGLRAKTVFEYRWGYIKVHKELSDPTGSLHPREVRVLETTLAPSLSDYGYREGVTEEEGAPPFSFGSNRWGKLRSGSDAPVHSVYLPRSVLLADPGIEGLEWFAGSDLSQWDLQLAGRRGQGQFRLQRSQDPAGLELWIAPLVSTNNAVALPKTCAFDYYLGLPILEGHALRPWLHTSFNRNQGNWVSLAQLEAWAKNGIQTIHCHNDGDYYGDGLFWRDGSYPPYPDMPKFDQVLQEAHQAGLRVATYFSNKELHPSTKQFKEHGQEWGRMDRKGRLQHNFFRGTNEFGVQMCLRSGWLEFLKFSIDRVLKNHSLDGVYYDWNVALYCCNGQHEGKSGATMGAGHWDIDELLDLMEWTRHRVGPNGLVIVHNTTTPMFTTENFADDVVANEWGYGTWKEDGPNLSDLPLEWSLVNARPRGVISYGQLTAQSPAHLHRLFALEALLSGVTPWPAGTETFDLFPTLKPLGKIEEYRFADWRNRAVILDQSRCAAAVYSRPKEAWVVLGNLEKTPQQVHCTVHPDRLPYPLLAVTAAHLVNGTSDGEKADIDAVQLTHEGAPLTLPADTAVLLHLR